MTKYKTLVFALVFRARMKFVPSQVKNQAVISTYVAYPYVLYDDVHPPA